MAQTFNAKLQFVAACYTKQLNVKITQTTVKKTIEENAYYPSLLSLSDTLSRFNIPNNAYEVDAESFSQLEAPFVALASIPGIGSDFVLVTAINNTTVSYIYDSSKATTVTKAAFVNQFKNVVLLAEPDDTSGDPDYIQKLAEEKALQRKKSWLAVGAAVLVLLAVAANLTANTAVAFGLIALIKLTGLAAAVLLLIFEINKNNAFIKNICSAGGKTNCDAVLGSKAAKIWGISWGEIGFFYFASTTLFLLMPAIPFKTKAALLSVANALAAPYIIFSIYYQWRVVKQWCPLCLTVQAALAAELAWGIANFLLQGHTLPPLGFWLLAPLQGMGVSIVSWYFLKPILLQAKDYKLYYNAYKRLQYNPETFNSLLVQQAKAAEGWQQLGITIGNPHAPNTIIKVCNPYCGPCAKTHPQLEEVIKQNNNVNLKIIFTARNAEHDRSAPVVKHLLAVAAKGIESKTQQALDDWYLADKKDYEAFAARYPIAEYPPLGDGGIEAMAQWCDEAEITHTPTIFINGYRLPENYGVEELKFIL